MKSFVAIPALFAVSALADGGYQSWGFTWTFSSGQSTWTSATDAPASWTAPPAAPTASSASWSEWVDTTSYTAVYSSGSSTWSVPTAVSYSEASNYTSMIPAPTPVQPSVVSWSSSSAPPPASIVVSTTATTPAAATFTGAAVQNIAGLGALAVAGLAILL